MAPSRTNLPDVYRRFGEEAAGTLYERVTIGLSESAEAMRVIASARRRSPASILAALHNLVLDGRAPTLSAAYDAVDADAAGAAAVETLTRMAESVVAIADRRRVHVDQTGRHAVLYPAIAEAARRMGARSIVLIDSGCAGMNLAVDRVGITYSDGQTLGDSTSPVQVSARVVGDRSLPATTMPEVVARIGIDPDPLDLTDVDDSRWLRACVWPDQFDRMAMLDAEIALAVSDPPMLLQGNVIDRLPVAIDRVPSDALPVVTTTWALSKFSVNRRAQFLDALYGTGRPVAWVSVEGVGVAPSIPTFGDRPASGHSIIGVATLDGSATHFDAVGRCWSRGRLLSWLADF